MNMKNWSILFNYNPFHTGKYFACPLQETVQKLPRELWIDALLKSLGQTVGERSEALRNCHARIVNSLVTAVNHIEMELQGILVGIANRIRPEVRTETVPQSKNRITFIMRHARLFFFGLF